MIIINMLLLSTLAGIISGVTGVGGGVLFTPLFKMFCDSGDFACRASDTVYLSMIAVLCSNAPGLFFSSKRSFVPVRSLFKEVCYEPEWQSVMEHDMRIHRA